jgi:trk system potassium uptake protein TrkH
MMSINWKVIFNVIGIILLFVGVIMILPSLWCAGQDHDYPLSQITSSLITIAIGLVVFLSTKHCSKDISKREGYLIVVFAWVCTTLVSSLPYYFGAGELSLVNSLFESVSGLTTTGATVFNDIEILPDCILLWRSLTQWLGGMGIIVLTVAIFPLLGIGGVELFVAESPGPTSNKIHPRIKETAKRLWLLYVSLTGLLILVLKTEGMSFFDALNHGLTTMATGGFSTKNSSIAHFDSPLIQYTILTFMFIAGMNYTIIYAGLKRKFKRIWRSDEFKAYIFLVFFTIFVISLIISQNTDLSAEESFRNAAFQVVSIVTTTGFVSSDYTAWHPSATMIFFCLLFAGACAGSTSGGIKIIRHLVFARNSVLESKRLLHPNALIRMRIDGNLVSPRILTHVLVFLLIYLLIFFVGTIIMSFILTDFDQPLLSAAGSVATCLGNVGPSIGDLGPLDNFSDVPESGKMILSFIMLLGRLELFSIMILFTPYFWRSN